jgi:two-component system sensor histidine kinase KdpD
VVGRLAAQIRERTKEAQDRARLASVRAQEAALVARVASAVLAGARIQDELPRDGDIRVSLNPVPTHSKEEHAVRLVSSEGSGWLYVRSGLGWEREDAERLAGALGRLVDVALERERLAVQAAETEATRRADVAKTAVLHSVSHDFRSPLTAITTAAGGLREGALSDADREDLLSVIEDESQRLARMVGDLLDLSKIEAGAVNPRTDWTDLRDVMSGAVAQVRSAHGDHPMAIELPEELPLVQADAAQLERVFANLIENAQRHAGGHAVQIRARATGGRLLVRVIDRGPGIPGELLPYVFEPFRRGDDGSHGGSGLGLAIVKGFVEAVDGRVWAESLPGQGTVFVVELPLTERPVTRA